MKWTKIYGKVSLGVLIAQVEVSMRVLIPASRLQKEIEFVCLYKQIHLYLVTICLARSMIYCNQLQVMSVRA